MLQDWWYFYRDFVTFPTIVTVGVGEESYMKQLNIEAEYLQILASEESLISYIEKDVDMKNLCNMFNVTLHVLTVRNENVTITRHDPDPCLLYTSPSPRD